MSATLQRLTEAAERIAAALESLATQQTAKPAPRPPKSGPALADPDKSLLADLWSAAPKFGRERSSKVQVAAAWHAIPPGKRPSRDQLLAAMRAFARCDQWRQDGGTYVEALHRWIKNRRWESPPTTRESSRPAPPVIEVPPPFASWHRDSPYTSLAPSVAWQTPRIRDEWEATTTTTQP